ncbi:phytoene/squalene synthase family protein [Pseudonocardia sp. WMMC193]|uniref:phytoene/squalene synthase family protein n=1 Tax=Pseudonocardia sp. WMMC193 TaxID=2911965 RepID=UPI001F416B0D|nr:phytoene/squalene synthase family protein [Pseudonocardia sp. WMMC193]MCF7548335.1 phytoene/squalene synthase family protein [Pseudonocardia sp. WMMC193]
MPPELVAAGITDPALQRAYRACRDLNAAHGRTYFLATRLLTPDRRPAIHALYGFARYADDIVDTLGALDPAEGLDELGLALVAAFEGGPSEVPVITAVADTVSRYGIDRRLFAPFLTSMRQDTHVTSYATMAELDEYMFGSAAVIGLQVLPVLGTVSPDAAEAAEPAAALGRAFQLTNFLRDVGEDLDRGRVYLPQDELGAFGVDRDLLVWCRTRRRVDPRVRRALAHLVARTRAIYRRAAPGIPMLAPESRDCVRTAFTLYGGILDEIVAADYDVLYRRVRVGSGRRAAVALPGLARAVAARRLRRS